MNAENNTTVQISGWKRWAALFGISGGQFVSFLSIFLGSSFFTGECEKRGISGVWLGVVTGMVQGATAIASIIVLGLAHIMPLKYFIIMGQGFCALTLFAFGFTNRIESPQAFLAICVVIRFLHGITMALSNISALVSVSRIAPPEKLATIMGFNEFCVAMGLAISPAFGGFLYDLSQFRTPYLVCGGLLLAFAILTLLLVPKEIELNKKSIRTMLRETASIKLSFFVITVIGGLVGFFSGMIEPHLRQYQLSASLVGSIIFVTNGVSALAFPILGHVCDASGKPALVIIASSLVGIIGLVLFGPFPGVPIPSELWIVILSLVLCGVSISGSSIGTYAQIRNRLGEICDSEENADMTACSSFAVWWNLGSFLTSVLGGIFIQNIGYRNGSAILLGVQSLTIIVEIFIAWQQRTSTLEFQER